MTPADRTAITDLIHLHGHLVDGGELERAGELFTEDVTYDVADFGLGTLSGRAALRDAALAVGDANPVGHHVTNVVITAIDERSARASSKGIGVMADGTVGSAVYADVVTRTPDGGRISQRTVTARRKPLGGRASTGRPTRCAASTPPPRCTSSPSPTRVCRPGSRAGRRS